MTRRISFAVALVLAVACSDDAARDLPTSPIGLTEAGSPVVASASGGAHLTVFANAPKGLGLRNFTFTARAHASGEVDGEWQLVAGGTIVHGDVTCLTVVDDRARIGGIVTDDKFSLGFHAGDEIAWEAVDQGEGGNASPDETSNLRAFLGAPAGSAAAFCLDGSLPDPGVFELAPIELGNVQVTGSTS